MLSPRSPCSLKPPSGFRIQAAAFSFRKRSKPFSLHAHHQRLSPASPADFCCPCSTKASQPAPCLSLRSLQHMSAVRNPSFHHPWRLREVGLSLRSLPLRVWLPSRGFSSRTPRKLFFSSQRSWVSPFRVFFRRLIEKRFPFLPSSLHF